jgi:hypothetical protein
MIREVYVQGKGEQNWAITDAIRCTIKSAIKTKRKKY